MVSVDRISITAEESVAVLAKNMADVVVNSESTGEPTFFDAKSVVQVPLVDYLRRWVRLTRASAEEIVTASCLIDRCVECTEMVLTDLNMHRVVLAALVITSKYVNDEPFTNTQYATVGGVTLAEIGRLEKQFFRAIDFDAHVNASCFAKYMKLYVRAKQSM